MESLYHIHSSSFILKYILLSIFIKFVNELNIFGDDILNFGVNKGGCAGPDGLSAYHHKQLYFIDNDDYKMYFRKYIEKIINGNIGVYELKNLMVSKGIPIPKKDPSDLRPLLINNIIIRIGNNAAVMSCMQQIMQNQLNVQYGMNKKNELNIIVHSFDLYYQYMESINDKVNNINNDNDDNNDYKDDEEKKEIIFDKNDDIDDEDDDINIININNKIKNDKKIKLLNILQNDDYSFGDDEYINNEILEILLWDNEQLDITHIIMKDDMSNCFNRIDRNMSLVNINNCVSNLYPAAYTNYAYPTKIVINNGIMYQMNGMGQGNVITCIALLLNEMDINNIMVKLINVLDIENNILIEKNYYDDSNKGDTIRKCIINHLLKKKIGIKYNNQYNDKKTEIILSHKNNFINNDILNYFVNKKFIIKEDGKYEILGIVCGSGEFNKFMKKKILYIQMH